jgi:hypothetical protein
MGRLSFEARDVHSEQERAIAEGQGFVWGGQGAAVAALDQRQFKTAEAEAMLNYDLRRMSAKAQAEANAVIERHPDHLADIPETPIKKRGRPVKTEPVSA